MRKAILLSVLAVCPALPAVMFNNFSAGDLYNTSVAYTIGDGAVAGNGGYSYAMPFTVLVSAALESIDMAVVHCGLGSFCGGIPPRNPATNSIIMSILDNTAVGGGNLIASVDVSGQMLPWATGAPVVHALFATQPLLTVGDTYWIRATVTDMQTDATLWGLSTNPQIGLIYQRIGNGAFGLFGGQDAAFRLNGTDTPEPGSFALLGAGLIAIGSRWRFLRRRLNIQ